MSRLSESGQRDPARPDDYIDGRSDAAADDRSADDRSADDRITGPKLGAVEWLRWFWRQLTSMRTALFLLLLLAVAAIPGSLVPQRTSDPNGVAQYRVDNPDLFPVLDSLQAFDTYSSVWFSSIYLLLFLSLIGCVLPRTKHHLIALRSQPPRTPARLSRMAGFTTRPAPDTAGDATDVAPALEAGRALLAKSGYRTVLSDTSVSAERGYSRETGNLVFHIALIGILVAVGIGGGFGYSGQRVVVEGQAFVNTLSAYDSFNPGRFVDENELATYRIRLEELRVTYEEQNENAIGQPIDYTAEVSTDAAGESATADQIKVNEPLRIDGTDVFLLGNGYAPTITVRNPAGEVVFTDSVPFLPQDTNLTSIGVIKVPDGLDQQLGMIGFFYPTRATSDAGDFSAFPDLRDPVLSLNVYAGDLGLDEGVPRSVYELDTDDLTQLSGRNTDEGGIRLAPGETQELPDGLGTVSLDDVPRFASFDIHHDPTQGWVLFFSVLVLGGLLTSLFVPRRRMWLKAVPDAAGGMTFEYAALARGDDPALEAAVTDFADRHIAALDSGRGAAAATVTTAQPGPRERI
ncbi:cytochrome c biogenesis protein ResB [Planctomonas psychrotolerans]|uniref:cytochrome c biogenesis protein ResB n=1 Tax=Planctomonas psychrotolerans TaxID=2528712 RepID=UPI0012389C4B|nr:cytochrome c biogenesis protein ResB [Planctomonas psychrotolerans]